MNTQMHAYRARLEPSRRTQVPSYGWALVEALGRPARRVRATPATTSKHRTQLKAQKEIKQSSRHQLVLQFVLHGAARHTCSIHLQKEIPRHLRKHNERRKAQQVCPE